MSRYVVAAWAVLFLQAVAAAAEAPQRPNVLFILTEDQGPHAGMYGTAGVQTPNMDRIAREGTLFRQAFVAYPVCSASKAALYTGLYPHTNGLRHNTHNYHKPAAKVTPQERNRPIARRMQIAQQYPTLIELLHAAGYYTGATHKLHVLPNEKFPYDAFIQGEDGRAVARFIADAKKADRPWFLMYNMRWPHRPYRNSDNTAIGVDPKNVDPPGHLPDTPVVRQDWAEYLDAVQQADKLVGEGLEALEASGQADRTIVVFMGDHGPCFQRGKMALTDFGLRVPLAVRGPGIPGGRTSDALVSEIDLMPTLLELLGLPLPAPMHGLSIAPLLRGQSDTTPRKYVVGEIHHAAQAHDNGMQERSIYDGRYRLIYREGLAKPRDLNADLWKWETWGNRTYDETIRRKDEYPRAYQLLRQLHPQRLGGKPPRLELYDTTRDPFELDNLAPIDCCAMNEPRATIGSPALAGSLVGVGGPIGRASMNKTQHAATLARLQKALAEWAKETDDRWIDREKLLSVAPKGAAGPRDLMSDTWPATDALGRTLPTNERCGPPRKDRCVGIFYFVWHGAHGTRGPFDVSRILAAHPDNPQWGPPGAFHHWGRPELGYYLPDDPVVLRRHASLLSDAGIDVAIIDVTNAFTYDKQVEALCRTWLAMRREGNATPAVAFLTHSSNAKTVAHLYEKIYAPGNHRPLWFTWQGKPLIMASPEGLSDEIRRFFTFRESWAWTHTKWFGDGRDKWPWIDNSPQGFGWHTPGVAEQMPVAVAGHPVSNLGRSHRQGVQPKQPGPLTERGVYFQQQWDRALAVAPPFVFVTGWNEWVAQRFVKRERGGAAKMTGRPLKAGDTYFVDQFDQEFSRDIEPMVEGHGDNYYYQLVANVRRYKGVRPLPSPSRPKTIRVDGDFSDWSDVRPEYRDTVGDTLHRDHAGWGEAGQLVDRAGRNDFVALKVAHDGESLYFYAETHAPITQPGGDAWMLLWIDADGNPKTGPQGYDYVVNGAVDPSGTSSIERLAADAKAAEVGRAAFAVRGNRLELALPLALVGLSDGVSFDFHWTDNLPRPAGTARFSTSADHAPNRRFNYRFRR